MRSLWRLCTFALLCACLPPVAAPASVGDRPMGAVPAVAPATGRPVGADVTDAPGSPAVPRWGGPDRTAPAGTCAIDGPALAGTRWQLEPAARTPEACAALEALVDRLPPGWTTPKRPVLVRVGSAPALPPDLSTPHTLAAPDARNSTITLAIDGLDARLDAWLIDHPRALSTADRATFVRQLLQRQWVHALTHLVDRREHLSGKQAWLRLGWSRSMRRHVPAERHPGAFVNRHGRVSPLEDLATVAEAYFVPEAFATTVIDLQPRCRMPSRWRFMLEHAGPEPATAPVCSGLEAVGLDPGQVEDIELVYIGSTLASAASIGGHVLVGLRMRPDAQGITTHDAYGLVAETGDLQGGPRYAWLGLTGGFLSRIVWQPFEVTLLRYSELEDRDVMRYRLVLTPEAKARVLARLDELRQAWDRPYYFVQRNCSQLPAELLRAALGESFQVPSWVSPDVIMALAAQRGLLEPIPIARPQELALGSRAMAAVKLREEAADRLIALNPQLGDRLKQALAEVSAAELEPRLAAYDALGSLAAELERQQGSLAELSRFLAWSDPIEQARHLDARRSGVVEREPAIDAIRRARAAVRRTASGAALPDPREAQQALISAVYRDRSHLSPHTSYRPLSILPTVIRSEGDTAGYVTLGGALYTFHRGDARQFGLSEGMELELLVTDVQLGVTRADRRRMRWKAGGISYIPSSLAWFRPGFYGGALDVSLATADAADTMEAADAAENSASTRSAASRIGRALSASGGQARMRADWAEGGLVLNLWETGYYQHAVGLRAGLALQSELDLSDLERSAAPMALAIPLGVEARFGSATQPLTALRTRWTWSPAMTSGLERRQEAVGTAQLRARVGSVSRIDVAVGAEYLSRWEGALPGGLAGVEQELRAGLWLERF